MLSARILYAQRAWWGKAMNDAKWKRGRQTLNSSSCVYHVSYYKGIYYKKRSSASNATVSVSAFRCPTFPFHLLALQLTSLYLGTKRGQAEISRLCMLTILFGLPACFASSLHPHVLSSQQIVYPSLTLGQQIGHFLCICVFVCFRCVAGSSSYPFSGGLTG